MNGGAALSGHVYQQDFIVFSMLASEARKLLIDDTRWIREFAIEGRSCDTGPIWDIRIERANGCVELLECKNTAISRDDRTTFYRRVRRDVATGTCPETLTVGWVTDPTKQTGDILAHFDAMRLLAASISDIDLSEEKNISVTSGCTALAEALYNLSDSRADASDPVALAEALALLSRLQIHRHKGADLSKSVAQLASGLFAQGASDSIRNYVIGDLSSTISTQNSVCYTRDAFIARACSAPLSLSAAGTLREILDYHSAARRSAEVPRIVWRALPNAPSKIWSLAERLPGLAANASTTIVGDTGVGKTATSWQLLDALHNEYTPHHRLRFAAGDMHTDIVRVLPQLLCILSGVARTWIVIDGLDEISPRDERLWRQTLSRILALAGCAVVLTVRREVLAGYDWLQQMTEPLAHTTLPWLSSEQVADAFREAGLPVPESDALLQSLRNVFLLSLYAQIAAPDDLPLRTSGEVTGFRVIEAFWSRRVVSESQGLRSGTSEGPTVHQKRKALRYLQRHMLTGADVITRDAEDAHEARGLDILLREGALVELSSSSIRWAHHWLYQYALVDRLIQGIDTPSAERLAERVVAIDLDHVRRVACIAATKWILTHADWGPIERFVHSLHGHCPPLASEVLPVLVGDARTVVSIAELPMALVVEFIEVAIQLDASHWAGAIAALPRKLFASARGPDLLDVIARYEDGVLLHG